jgi:hypothetical protein
VCICFNLHTVRNFLRGIAQLDVGDVTIRTYVGYFKVIAYVPHSVVKGLLAQQDCLGVRGKWVSKIQEYDLEIEPTMIMKGHGLEMMLVEGSEKALGMNCFDMVFAILKELGNLDWYFDIIYFFKFFSYPEHLTDH